MWIVLAETHAFTRHHGRIHSALGFGQVEVFGDFQEHERVKLSTSQTHLCTGSPRESGPTTLGSKHM